MPVKLSQLGSNIQRFRLLRKKTQLQLAHLIGYKGEDAGSYISRVESGDQEPRLSTLYRIAAALKVDLEQLTAKE